MDFTYKADAINEYPFLVYSDESGSVYDASGGGGGESPKGIVELRFAIGLEIDPENYTELYFNSDASILFADLEAYEGFLSGEPFLPMPLVAELTFFYPVGYLLQGAHSFLDMENNRYIVDETTKYVAYSVDIDTYESTEIPVEIGFDSDNDVILITIPNEPNQLVIIGFDVEPLS